MKAIKRIAIWLAAMLVTIFIVNVGGSFIIKKMATDKLAGAFVGYVYKGNVIDHSSTTEETKREGKQQGSLFIRSALSDDHLANETEFFYNFLFANFTADVSNRFFTKDGVNELSSGIFALVYQDNGEKLGYVKNSFGVIDLNDFCKLDCASEVYDVLKNESGVEVKLNSYTIDGYIVKPVSITLLDANGKELLNVECPYEGELIKKSDCLIRNDDKEKENMDCLYYKMRNAYLGERKTDKIADKLIDEVTFDNDVYDTYKVSYGFASMTAKYIDVRDGYAQITVINIKFIKGVVFYTVILGGIMSIIMLIVIKIKSH